MLKLKNPNVMPPRGFWVVDIFAGKAMRVPNRGDGLTLGKLTRTYVAQAAAVGEPVTAEYAQARIQFLLCQRPGVQCEGHPDPLQFEGKPALAQISAKTVRGGCGSCGGRRVK